MNENTKEIGLAHLIDFLRDCPHAYLAILREYNLNKIVEKVLYLDDRGFKSYVEENLSPNELLAVNSYYYDVHLSSKIEEVYNLSWKILRSKMTKLFRDFYKVNTSYDKE